VKRRFCGVAIETQSELTFVDLSRVADMSSFSELLSRVRAGDDAATSEIFRTYAPHVKSLVRSLMRIQSVRLMAEPSDVYQSVMASFFIRAAVGQYDIDEPRQLMALLKAMAKNKVVDLTRQPDRRISSLPVFGPGLSGIEPVDSGTDPASEVLRIDLARKIRERFTDDEREISDLRLGGDNWADVGARLGIEPNAARMRLERALSRIGKELNLGGWFDD
jgi:DNA-directed RNA polymerase specialized sigma24 family protein